MTSTRLPISGQGKTTHPGGPARWVDAWDVEWFMVAGWKTARHGPRIERPDRLTPDRAEDQDNAIGGDANIEQSAVSI